MRPLAKIAISRAGDTGETPEGVSDGLHELRFAQTDGLIFVPEGGEVAFVFGGVVGGEQNRAAGEPGFDGVEGRGGLTRFVFGPVESWALARFAARRAAEIGAADS